VDNENQKSKRAAEVGEKVGRKIGQTVNQIERETQKVINYIESDVVPAVREESTSALRTAAKKLAEFADYLDDQRRKQGK
jgi:predicted urease superfamily metal-dependent hydrolase